MFTHFKKALGRLKFRIISLEKFYILERLLSVDPESYNLLHYPAGIPDCVIKRLPPAGDLFKRFIDFSGEMKKETITELLEDGHICLLALINDRIIGSGWISTRYVPYSELLKVAGIIKGTAYLYKIFVSEEARGRGVGTALICEMLRTCEESGFTKASAIVYDWNRASIKLFNEKLRFEKSYKLFLLNIGPLRRCCLFPLKHRPAYLYYEKTN